MSRNVSPASKDARELRLVIRRNRNRATIAVVMTLLSIVGMPIANAVLGGTKPTRLAAVFGLVAIFSLGAAILLIHHVVRLREILKDIEIAIDRGR